MTTNTLTKIKALLNTNGYLPNGIDMNTRLVLIDAKATTYQYWGFKYSEGNENHDNSAVGLQFSHSMVENPFWIVLFDGAQEKAREVQLVQAFWELPQMDDAIHGGEGIKSTDTEDGVETILDIVSKFDYLWFTEDEASEEAPLTYDDSNALENAAEAIIKILNLNISISTPLELVGKSHVDEIKEALKIAQNAYINSEGKKLLNELLLVTDSSRLLSSFVAKLNISKISFEEINIAEDFMPDYGKYIVLEGEVDGKKHDFGFLFESSETFIEIDGHEHFSGTSFCTELEFTTYLIDNEVFKNSAEWDTTDDNEASNAWTQIMLFNQEGYKRELFPQG